MRVFAIMIREVGDRFCVWRNDMNDKHTHCKEIIHETDNIQTLSGPLDSMNGIVRLFLFGVQ